MAVRTAPGRLLLIYPNGEGKVNLSIFRIPRRLKLYRNTLLWILLLSLLPMTLLLAVSRHNHITDARESLEKRAERAYREMSLLLKKADETLNRIATAVERDEPNIQETLQRAVYDSPYFREAGVIDENGFLKLTNLRPVDPPVFITPQHRSSPGIAGIQLIGPVQTTLMRERSIILSLRTNGSGEVNLLVNPFILFYFLDIADETNLGPDGFIGFAKANGEIIIADGLAPTTGQVVETIGNSKRIRVNMETPDGSFKVLGEISSAWVLRHWRKQVMFGVPITFISVFLLLSTFLFFFRRAQAFDYDLKTGLKDNEFELYYQPIVDISSGACVASEALLRWKHPEEGVLLPNLFVPSAEKTGLIGPIGEWVVKQTVTEQSPLFDRYPLKYVSINLSAVQLNLGSFENTIKWLPTTTLDPEYFVFEITEKAMIKESQTTAMHTLLRVRKLGCSVALDDFGTGYSSLGNLTKFDFAYLKIEQQFVRGINRDIRTNSILEAIVEMGHKLGVAIIAEGVETEEQKDYLQSLGVPYAQGWFFSTPLPIDEFESYLSDQSTGSAAT